MHASREPFPARSTRAMLDSQLVAAAEQRMTKKKADSYDTHDNNNVKDRGKNTHPAHRSEQSEGA